MVLVKTRASNTAMMSVMVVHHRWGRRRGRMYTLGMAVHHEIMLLLLLVRIRRLPWWRLAGLASLHGRLGLAGSSGHKVMHITREVIVIMSRGGSHCWGWDGGHATHGVTVI